jgi:hypothetical protein
VAALAYSATTGTVYTAGADGHVCELDADSGAVQANWKAGKTPLTALAASADGDRLLVAGASLSLWDLASHERMGKLSGHAIPAHLVAFSPDASRAVSAAPGEPAVVLWNGTGGGGTPGKGARAGALATLSMDHPPAQLTTHATGGKKHFGVLAVCEVGPTPVLRPSIFGLCVREEGHCSANVCSRLLSAAAGASARNLRIGNDENDLLPGALALQPSSWAAVRRTTHDRITVIVTLTLPMPFHLCALVRALPLQRRESNNLTHTHTHAHDKLSIWWADEREQQQLILPLKPRGRECFKCRLSALTATALILLPLALIGSGQKPF